MRRCKGGGVWMRHVDMKAALYSMGSRVGLGCVSQSDTPSQSSFRLLVGGEQLCNHGGSRQKTGAQYRTHSARACPPAYGGL